jgi:lysophospholipase L1-like esterase
VIRDLLGDPNPWEASIRQFELEDQFERPADDEIMFLGSSTFTLWSDIGCDMSPLTVVNRGFGGSKMADMSRYFDRIVFPRRPKTIILFAGTNDIAGLHPATAQQVYEGYLEFVDHVRNALPETQVYYLAITPTPSRWKHWGVAKEANRKIRQHTDGDPRLHFIDPSATFMGPHGKPDRRFFRMDRLHPSRKGYAVLARNIRKALRESPTGIR